MTSSRDPLPHAAEQDEDQLDRLYESVISLSSEASMLRQEVFETNRRADEDRNIMQAIRRIIAAVVAALAILTVICVVLLSLVLQTTRTEDLANDCLQPGGQCAQRLQQQNSLTQELLVEKIESQRIATSIAAAEAQLRVGSPTAQATLEALNNSKAVVDARVIEIQNELNALGFVPPVSSVTP